MAAKLSRVSVWFVRSEKLQNGCPYCVALQAKKGPSSPYKKQLPGSGNIRTVECLLLQLVCYGSVTQ